MFSAKKRGFTLIELLTVVAIIALLIGILVPAVNRARQNAVKTAVKAQLYGIGQGLEMFKGDFGYYPSSCPQTIDGVNAGADRTGATAATMVVQGAHRLAFALMGRDKQGAPAKKGAPAVAGADTGPDSIAAWYYSQNPNGTFTGTQVVTTANWGGLDQKTARKGPYLDPKGFNTIKDGLNTGTDYVWVLSDKYDRSSGEDITTGSTDYPKHSVILYYAANERGRAIPASGTANLATRSDQIYFAEDNEAIAGITGNFRGTTYNTEFWGWIEDQKSVVNGTHRPYNPEGFVLISRGWDGIYGTEDDVVNWEN